MYSNSSLGKIHNFWVLEQQYQIIIASVYKSWLRKETRTFFVLVQQSIIWRKNWLEWPNVFWYLTKSLDAWTLEKKRDSTSLVSFFRYHRIDLCFIFFDFWCLNHKKGMKNLLRMRWFNLFDWLTTLTTNFKFSTFHFWSDNEVDNMLITCFAFYCLLEFSSLAFFDEKEIDGMAFLGQLLNHGNCFSTRTHNLGSCR